MLLAVVVIWIALVSPSRGPQSCHMRRHHLGDHVLSKSLLKVKASMGRREESKAPPSEPSPLEEFLQPLRSIPKMIFFRGEVGMFVVIHNLWTAFMS